MVGGILVRVFIFSTIAVIGPSLRRAGHDPAMSQYLFTPYEDWTYAHNIVKPLTIRTSLKSLRLSLHDEKQKKMISFRSLKARASG